MATFTVTLDSPLPAVEAWERVWALDSHTRLIPLTTLSGDGVGRRRLREGSRFVARTGVGPLGFDDVMTVTTWHPPQPGHPQSAGDVLAPHEHTASATPASTAPTPATRPPAASMSTAPGPEDGDAPVGAPGRAVVAKSGRVIRGRIEMRIDDTPAGSRLTWTQHIGVRGAPRVADPVVALVARTAYTQVLRRLLDTPAPA